MRSSYGSILVPLFEEDGLRMGELARRAHLSKKTMTTMVRLLEREGLVHRKRDPADGRAFRVVLTAEACRFEPVAERTLEELAVLAQQRLGERRLQMMKHTFTMFQAPGQPDEQFEGQYHSLVREFENLELPFSYARGSNERERTSTVQRIGIRTLSCRRRNCVVAQDDRA